ncbi:hypothetical protein PYCC9005_001271 [Savitreella phatthalungensis]
MKRKRGGDVKITIGEKTSAYASGREPVKAATQTDRAERGPERIARTAIKASRTMEMQKLTKRLKRVRDEPVGEDGDQDRASRISRLEEELEAAKGVNLDELACWVAKYAVWKHDKELAADQGIHKDDVDPSPHANAFDAMKNVVARLLGAKITKDATARIVQLAAATSGSQSDKQSDGSPDGESSSEDEADHVMKNKASRKVAPLKPDTSAFLPALSSGYLPGSFSDEEGYESADGDGSGKRGPAQKKERKNRRGQRARRKILEQKFGKKANHLVKERREKWEELEARRLKREAKAAAAAAAASGASGGIQSTATGANAIIPVDGNRRERREAALRPQHNSWQLAQAKKVAEKEAKPAGQKVVFD